MTDNRAVFTKYEDKYVLMHIAEDEVKHIYVYPQLDGYPIGTVINCRIDRQIDNIGASFIQYGQKSTGYLNKKYPNGSILPLMYKKEENNDKKPLFSDVISIEGEYTVVSNGAVYVKASSKIPETDRRQLIEEFNDYAQKEKIGVIIRTAAYTENKGIAKAKAELYDIVAKIKEIDEKSSHLPQYSVLYSPLPTYIKDIIYLLKFGITEVVTDVPSIMEKLEKHYGTISISRPVKLTDRVGLRFYNDNLLDLSKLYSFSGRITACLARKVFLKSGAYITIDQTEALTAIDVNTASNNRNLSKDETFLAVNLEAATEVARQIVLRNISGMIIIDFINMNSDSHYEKLKEHIVNVIKSDREDCRFIDFTALKLCELTRSRRGKTLYQCLRGR